MGDMNIKMQCIDFMFLLGHAAIKNTKFRRYKLRLNSDCAHIDPLRVTRHI